MAGAISNPAVSANSVVNTPIVTGGASAGGYLVEQKDSKTRETDAKFGEVLKNIQTKYGAKPEKAREIKKTLGKDDFLKIMITQMKNQDPTKPFNADEMAAQMAQYASVEQLQNVNQNLGKLQADHQGTDRMAMTGLIGKTVTVDRERFPHNENMNESLGYALSKNASEVKITILSETGETILEKDLGAQKAGDQTYAWDGLKGNTLPAKAGGYSFKIVAKDEHGNALPTDPKMKGRIVGVSFEGAEPVFLVGDAQSQQKITMKNIVKIDDLESSQPPRAAMTMPTGMPMNMAGNMQGSAITAGAGNAGAEGAGANSAAGTASQTNPSSGKFFSFTKGEGSQNIDTGGLSPETLAALQKYNEQKAEAEGAAGKSASSQQAQAQNAGANNEGGVGQAQKGFPSGLGN